MSIIYVQDRHGKPLAAHHEGRPCPPPPGQQAGPCGLRQPFTIRLMYGVDPCTQGFILGIDPGRTNIGVTVAAADGTCVFSQRRRPTTRMCQSA